MNYDTPKILLLGISYPDVYGQMEEHQYDDDILNNSELSVNQAVECVRRKILTEMDGRDLARCVATEQAGVEKGSGSSGSISHQVYTVSKEVGGVYRKDRHVYASFNNSRGMRKAMLKAFNDVQFQQVILDYYWMPTGWLVTRWNKTLFQETLPDLVRYRMLAFPVARSRRSKPSLDGNKNKNSNCNNKNKNIDNQNITETTENNNAGSEGLEEGVVFLPFCAHVCKELVGGIHILKNYYAISFVKKKELPGHALWKGTMSIDADIMQHRLGKQLDQEEIYCRFKPSDIYQSMEDAHVNKDDVMRMFLSIDDFDDIRMIRLRPLRQHEPPSVFRDTVIKPEVGGFIDLNWAKGRERFKEYRTRKKIKPPPPKLPPKQKRKATPKPNNIVTPIVVESDSEGSDFVYDTNSECSSDEHSNDEHDDEEDDDEMDITEDTTTYYDPCDPNNIPDVTNYYPYPALDINSYTGAKQIVDDDRVMTSWAETWGPKSGRKKNRKQDIFQNEYKKFRKRQKSYLSSNSRLPDPNKDDEEGYKWTMSAEDGWELSLKGDAPDARYDRKIIGLAKRDYAMTACRQLFEMKNPGFKTLSRAWLNNDQFISCYQIPKKFVLFKREKAAIEAKKLKSKTTSSDDLVVEYDHFPDTEDTTESVSNEENCDDIDQLSEEIDASQKSTSILAQFADFVSTTPPVLEISDNGLPAELKKDSHIGLPDELKNICKGSKGVYNLILHNVIPAFKSKLITKHLYYDLSPHENFPRELYRLLQDAEEKIIEHIVCWQTRDRSFIVRDRGLFEKIVLSDCCEGVGATYNSFIQNLISFGFVEIKIGSRRRGYRHELFRRGKTKKLALISQDKFANVRKDEIDASGINDVVDDSGINSLKNVYDFSCQKLFIENLYCLLQDSNVIGLSNVISWKESGKSFAVHKPKNLYTKILKKSSCKTSFENFHNKLIDSGFKFKKKCSSYEHPHFIRGHCSALDIFKDDESNNEWRKMKKRKRRSETESAKYIFSRQQKFPRELYSLLEDSEKKGYMNFIHWLPSGDSFAITNKKIFANTILQRKCIEKGCKTFSWFEDTLIWAGFEKFGTETNDGCFQYRHQHFVRGQVKRLNLIKPNIGDVNVTNKARKTITSADTTANERVRISSPSSQSETLTPSSESEDFDSPHVISAPPSAGTFSTVNDETPSAAENLMTVVNKKKSRRMKRSSDAPVGRKLSPRRTRTNAVWCSHEHKVVVVSDVLNKLSREKNTTPRESRTRNISTSSLDKLVVVKKISAK